MADLTLPKSGIYCIRNVVNGKVYVGSARDIADRWHRHKRSLVRGKHHSGLLQSAWQKHGADAFEFLVLESVENTNDLILREQSWIDRLKAFEWDAGYNMYPKAASPLGTKASDETRAKLSLIAKNRVRRPEDIAKFASNFKGKKRSAGDVAKMRARSTGVRLSAALKAHLSAINIGKRHSEASRAKMSIASTGRRLTPEAIEKTAAWHRGKKRSAETCAKISAARRADIASRNE